MIISYYWPPSSGSGVQRWLKFAKYLPKYGWQPVIYTPENPDFDLKDDALLDDVPAEAEIIKRPIWEPYALARQFSSSKEVNTGLVTNEQPSLTKRIMNWVRGNVFIPDPRVYWVKPSVKYLNQYLQDNPVDVIVSTGPPHSMHLIGLGIKKQIGIPWIADFRDPWSKLDFLDTYGISVRNRKKYAKMERDVLKACDMVLATSPSMPNQLEEFDKRKFRCITNGYDLDDFDFSHTKEKSNDEFCITHAGLINDLRNPIKLWSALDQYCGENTAFKERLVIKLIGQVGNSVIQQLQTYKHISNRLRIMDYMPHDTVLKEYQQADLLLMLINNSENSKVNIPGKLFELMATNNSILGIGKAGDDALEILSGYHKAVIRDYDDEIDISEIRASVVSHALANHTEHKTKYSRQALTSKLSDLMNELITTGNRSQPKES